MLEIHLKPRAEKRRRRDPGARRKKDNTTTTAAARPVGVFGIDFPPSFCPKFRNFERFFFFLLFLEMSNVHLSSMALERLVARRTFPLHRRTSVCRNLFGPVDHEELSRDMKAKMREISERDQQRWNFDFNTDTPLDGDYQWEEVEVERTPAFYRDSVPAEWSRSTPLRQPSSADSVLAESPRMDILERLALPDSSPGSSPGSPVEVNQENRADKLNSGRATHTRSRCVRRKRTETTDNSNTQITGKPPPLRF